MLLKEIGQATTKKLLVGALVSHSAKKCALLKCIRSMPKNTLMVSPHLTASCKSGVCVGVIDSLWLYFYVKWAKSSIRIIISRKENINIS